MLTFSFTTESTVDTLELLSATTLAGPAEPIKVNPTGLNTHLVNPALPGLADVYVGVLSMPYYLSRSAPLTGFWHAPPFPLDTTSTFTTRFNPLPVPTETLLIPVLVTVPNATSGHDRPGRRLAGGDLPARHHAQPPRHVRGRRLVRAGAASRWWPSTCRCTASRRRSTRPTRPRCSTPRAPIPSTPASACRRAARSSAPSTWTSRTTSAAPPAPDGIIDPSGIHFINLTSLLTSRDNLREGVADLVTFAHALPALEHARAAVNPAAIHYVGHSLGAIVGGTYLAVVPDALVTTGTLAMPGGGMTRLLQDSPTFGPQINAGLAAQGVTPGTTLYAQFFRDCADRGGCR